MHTLYVVYTYIGINKLKIWTSMVKIFDSYLQNLANTESSLEMEK